MGSLCCTDKEVQRSPTELSEKISEKNEDSSDWAPPEYECEDLYSEFSGSEYEDSDFGGIETKPSFARKGYVKDLFKPEVYDWAIENLKSQKVLNKLDKVGPFKVKTQDKGAKKTAIGYKVVKDDTYFGQAQGEIRCGRGVYIEDGKNLYEGFLLNNKPHGKGRLIFKNGDMYQGDFENGIYSGYGKLVTKAYFRQGYFEEGKMNGQGFEVYKTDPKDRYFGQWLNDKKHGIGELQFENGDCYNGSFKNNTFNGDGTMKFANGDVYTGHYKDGKMHGRGRYDFKSGKLYAGYFEDNMFEGEGTLSLEKGETYEGRFHKGKKHGKGYLIDRQGRRIKVKFENGKQL
ncbi:unnamed protein product [Moneuplotes crassus]|uniref:Phosphatidylinositol-4-phosphate 5-kinase n=1 Tax=Euplotes crassus TaxID=5936 RepID=A0AAD1UEY1_EUPCR|nr:unnamed protein product [Moneuplotes crassus]